jgi:hypothetical protein
MTEKKTEAISRRAALRKLGLGTAVFVAPMVVTVSEAEAKSKSSRKTRKSKYHNSRASYSEKSRKRYTDRSSYYSEPNGEDEYPGSISQEAR